MGVLDNSPYGLPITLQFIAANLSTGAGTVDMTFGQGGTGFKVPTGYVFHPQVLFLTKTGTLDANATVIAKVIYDGTELVSGPQAQLDQADTDTHDTGIQRVGPQPAAAGVVVGVSLTKDADYSTTGTIDYDAVLVGLLLPA